MSKLGERLKKAREHAGLTQPQLEALTGIKQATISKIELGKNKTEETAFGVHLAVACGVRPEWLVLDIGPMINEIKADEIQLLDRIWLPAAESALTTPSSSHRFHKEGPLTARGPFSLFHHFFRIAFFTNSI